jgi:hypothetical protein
MRCGCILNISRSLQLRSAFAFERPSFPWDEGDHVVLGGGHRIVAEPGPVRDLAVLVVVRVVDLFRIVVSAASDASTRACSKRRKMSRIATHPDLSQRRRAIGHACAPQAPPHSVVQLQHPPPHRASLRGYLLAFGLMCRSALQTGCTANRDGFNPQPGLNHAVQLDVIRFHALFMRGKQPEMPQRSMRTALGSRECKLHMHPVYGKTSGHVTSCIRGLQAAIERTGYLVQRGEPRHRNAAGQ